MKQPTDEQIRIRAERISQGDQKAFDDLFRSLYPQLVPFACRYTRSMAIAQDLVQDAFVSIWQKRKNINPDQSLKAYLYRTVRNKALNHLRDHANETVGIELQDYQNFNSKSNTESEDPLLEKAGLLHNFLKKWIHQLPERRREAFELSRFEGLDHEEIADVMDVSVNTVNNHIVAALRFLRNCYEQYPHEAQTNTDE